MTDPDVLAAHFCDVANAVEARGTADAFDVPVLLRQAADAIRRLAEAPPAAALQFLRRCWDYAREGREIEGPDVQEWGHELGLLKLVTAPAPCGDHCQCEEYGVDFPTDCYRLVEAP